MSDPLFSRPLPFVLIDADQTVVRDYLAALRHAPVRAIDDAIRTRDEIQQTGERVFMNDMDITDDVLANYDSNVIPSAREHAMTLREGAGSLLVFAFLERGLRVICEHVADGGESAVLKWADRYLRKRRGEGEGKIDAYLAFLRDEGRLTFALPNGFDALRSSERKVRNVFAHGDWDTHYFMARDGDAERQYEIVIRLFDALAAVVTK